MNKIAKFLLAVFSFAPMAVWAAPVSQTAGSNLTGYNGSMGNIAGNRWNNDLNPRAQADAKSQPKAKADYGNCEAIILRCAKPKCSGGGCADAGVAQSIVAGCIRANSTCKKFEADLTEPLAGQLVAASVADRNKQESAANAAASAAQQSNQMMQQQMQQMQQQMMQMQQENSQQIASLQNALTESQQATADAVAAAADAAAKSAAAGVVQNSSTVVDAGTGLTPVQAAAAAAGVEPEVVSRATISGDILTSMEGVDSALANLKTTMREIFKYGNCNELNGDNCSGPKRVKKFRELAQKFFEPYDALADSLEQALYTAQVAGVDLGNIYMFFSGSCNRWAKYICRGNFKEGLPVYNELASGSDKGIVIKGSCVCQNGDCKSKAVSGWVRGGRPCSPGQVIPPEDLVVCSVNEFLDATDDNLTDTLLNPDINENGTVRVGCASDLTQGLIKRRRSNGKGKAGIDVDLLEMLVSQSEGSLKHKDKCKDITSEDDCKNDAARMCGLGFDSEIDAAITKLQTATISKALGKSNDKEGACCEDAPGVGSEKCKTSCYDLDKDIGYVDPVFALCDTHVWNAGFVDNNLGADNNAKNYSENESKVKSVIGLKTTVIAQQMYKQYTTLEKMIKQIRVMLEKEVLKAHLQVSQGTSNGGSGDNNTASAEFDNCNLGDEKAVLDCLRGNLPKYVSAIAKKSKTSALKKAMYEDSEVLKIYTAGGGDYEYKDDENVCKKTMSNNDVDDCVKSLQKGINQLNNQIRKHDKEFSTSSSFSIVPQQ